MTSNFNKFTQPSLPEKKCKMLCQSSLLFSFTPQTSPQLKGFRSKTTYVGNRGNYSVQSAGNFAEQLVGDVVLKRRSVAGVDQKELFDPENLADPDSLFLDFNGVRIHHKICHFEANKDEKEQTFPTKVGFPTILLHGFGASVFSWGRIMKPLSLLIGSKILAFDRPAFGLTSRKSYVKNNENPYSLDFSVLATISFIDMLGAGKAILMGHSAGCLVAVNAYFESPEKIAALILVSPAIFVPLFMKKDANENFGAVENPFSRIWHGICKLYEMFARFMLRVLGGLSNMVSSVLSKLVAAVLRSAFGIMLVRILFDKFGISAIRKSWYDASQLTDDIIQGYTKPLRAKGWDSAILEFTIAMLSGSSSKQKPKPRISKRLSEIKCPVLIVTGDTDRIVPSWNAKRLAEFIPGSMFEIIPKCGHLPHEEKAQEFLSAIKKFLYETFGAKERQFTEVAI